METQERKPLSKTKLIVASGIFILGAMFFPAVTLGITLVLILLSATKKRPDHVVATDSEQPLEAGRDHESKLSPTTTEAPITEQKIGGFLYLVAFSMLIGPFVLLDALREYFKELPRPILESLTQVPLLNGYTALLIGAMLIACLVFWIFGVIAFFRKSKLFPPIFIGLQLAGLGLTLASIALTLLVDGKVPSKEAGEFFKLTIISIFWIAVFLRSERVKRTFLKVDPITNSLFHKRVVSTATALVIFIPLLLLLDARKRSSDPFDKLAKQNSTNEKNSTEIAEMALDNLVVVKVYDKKKREIKSGSGFYFLTEDLIVTNYHVISGASYVLFRKANADEDDAEAYNYVRNLVAVDREIDLAIFRTKYKNKSSLPAGKASELEIGEKIYVAGNPRGFEGTFSDGLLSNKFSMDGIHHLQITAPISSGSSGGPLLNRKGEAVGIVTASIKKGQNLNLAIPSYYVGALLEKERDDLTSAQKPNVGIEITKKGRGKKAVAGDQVTVHYAGMLPSKKIFDSSEERDQPFTFTLGAGQVIEGWDQGIVGMRVGEERILKIPAELAYGSKGVGKVIPPNSPLTFGIRLLEIKSSDDRVGH